jgi:hypothetical protein
MIEFGTVTNNKIKNTRSDFIRSSRIKSCGLSFFGKTEYFTSFNVK